MKVLHNNVLVIQDTSKESTTAGGLILTSSKPSGQSAAKVISMSNEVAAKMTIVAGSKVYFDWSKAMAVELEGIQCAVIDYDNIKLIVD
tara:strand:+ start:103 stop:369 length:267 start_codon:yes stop_codon:yes gene_type:complete